MERIELSKVFVKGEELQFDSAKLIINEEQKNWYIDTDGADRGVMLNYSGFVFVEINIIAKDGEHYVGNALADPEARGFQGSGEIIRK